jgi:hypothetical protein
MTLSDAPALLGDAVRQQKTIAEPYISTLR